MTHLPQYTVYDTEGELVAETKSLYGAKVTAKKSGTPVIGTDFSDAVKKGNIQPEHIKSITMNGGTLLAVDPEHILFDLEPQTP